MTFTVKEALNSETITPTMCYNTAKVGVRHRCKAKDSIANFPNVLDMVGIEVCQEIAVSVATACSQARLIGGFVK